MENQFDLMSQIIADSNDKVNTFRKLLETQDLPEKPNLPEMMQDRISLETPNKIQYFDKQWKENPHVTGINQAFTKLKEKAEVGSLDDSFVQRVIKNLDQAQRVALKRRLEVSIDTIPSFKRVIEDWVSLCILADKKVETKQRFYTKVWQTIESSLPILIHSTETRLTNSAPNIWKVRVLSHKVDGKCIDIRQFNKIENLTSVEYEPTDNGLTLPIKDWFVILDTVIKYLRKYK